MTRTSIFILFTITILCILFVTPSLAISTTTVEGSISGSISYSQCVSMETSGDNLPRFGVNQTDYTYDGSQTSVLTNGRTQFTRTTTVDQTDSNYYVGKTGLSTDYMGLAEDTAGMINIQPNEPEQMCDQAGMLSGAATSGQYPVSETFEGRTGVVLHNGGAYESEVGLNDGDVHLSGAADITSKGYLYQNKRLTSMKGFDKNTTALNLQTSETMNAIIRTTTVDGEEEVHKRVTSDYSTITPAFDEVITEAATSTIIESISADRVDETINETVNESVNLTPTELPDQSHGESIGLQDLTNESIQQVIE